MSKDQKPCKTCHGSQVVYHGSNGLGGVEVSQADPCPTCCPGQAKRQDKKGKKR